MTNPVTPFRNDLFGSRGMDIQAAMDYVETMINTFQGTEYAAAKTAIGVLVNTIERAVTQSQGPSPEKIAVTQLISSIISEQLNVTMNDVDEQISNWMNSNLKERIMDIVAEDDISDQISNWMSNNFDLDDYNVDGAIEQWMDNNIDDKVYDAVNSISFTVEIGR
jgi:superfamily II helicase